MTVRRSRPERPNDCGEENEGDEKGSDVESALAFALSSHRRTVSFGAPASLRKVRDDSRAILSFVSFRVPVIFGSVRTGRQGIKAARFVVNELRDRGCEPVLIDPLLYKLPLLDKMYKEYAPGQAPAQLQELADLYRSADGFAIVSGEYNNGIPPALKNLLDHFLEEYFWRPSGIICYSGGQFGGVRAAMQLRMTLAELGMPSIPSLLAIPKIETAIDERGEPSNPAFRGWNAAFFDEFLWYMEALRTQRGRGVPY